MEQFLKVFRIFWRKFGFLEYTVLVAVIILGAAGYSFLFPYYTYTSVTLQVADKEFLWNDRGSPTAQTLVPITVGLKEKDGAGRTVAEITRVVSFDRPSEQVYPSTKKTAYVTVNLRAAYNKATGQFHYRGIDMGVGDWVSVRVGNVTVSGIVVSVGEQTRLGKPVTVILEAKLAKDEVVLPLSPNQPLGVEGYIADSIQVGDTVKDSDGTILAEVLDKRVAPAGPPGRFEMFLRVKLVAQQIGKDLIYLDLAPIKVNARLPLLFPHINIQPQITQIESASR